MREIDSTEWKYFEFRTDMHVDKILSFYIIGSSVGKCAMKLQKPQSEVMAHCTGCY